MSTLRQTYVAVVDDDENAGRAFGRLLRAEGFQPVCYLSAEAFLADTKRPVFDCLVFDVQLGGMSGIELHRLLVASGSSTPVIYVTAHDEPQTREQAEAAGCTAYFRKTAPGQDVLQAIRRAASSAGAPSDHSRGNR
jgi:FixJ family two-component response regulator